MADIQVGLAIRLTRVEKKLSRTIVAQRMGTCRSYLLRVEASKVIPSVEQFARIADAMEEEPGNLLAYARQLQREAEM